MRPYKGKKKRGQCWGSGCEKKIAFSIKIGMHNPKGGGQFSEFKGCIEHAKLFYGDQNYGPHAQMHPYLFDGVKPWKD